MENHEQSIDKLKERVKAIRNGYLQVTDFTQLNDAPFTAKEKQLYTEYESWWEQNPKTFEEWLNEESE